MVQKMGDKSQRNKIHPVHVHTKMNRLPSRVPQQCPPTNCLNSSISKSTPRLTSQLGSHIQLKRLALNNRSRQLSYLLTFEHVNLKNKLLIYKSILRPMAYNFWGLLNPPISTKYKFSNPIVFGK